jgi:hypothetical protein
MNVNRGLLGALCLSILACQKGNSLQIVKVPALTPMITADSATGEFYVNAAVKNLSSEPTPTHYLSVVTTWSGNPVCEVPSFGGGMSAKLEVPPLAPGAQWSIPASTKLLSLPPNPLNNCVCQKGTCGGTTRFILHRNFLDQNPHGPNTDLELIWPKSGNIDEYQLINHPH